MKARSMTPGMYVAPESSDELRNEIVFLCAVLDALPNKMTGIAIKRVMRKLFPSPCCHYCERSLVWPSKAGKHEGCVSLDHIIPQSHGGRWRPWNLIIACFNCNQARGNMDYETFKKRAPELARARRQHEQAA
jgi:5-methylcytosine-specific restriction endonuclease McrA